MKKWYYGILAFAVFIFVMNAWTPWHRSPVIFYSPMIYPVEAIKGDVIVLEDGSQMVIDHDMTVNSIEIEGEVITIKTTKHLKLWELIIGRAESPSTSLYPAGTFKNY